MRFHGHGTVSPALSAESRPVVPCSRAEAAKYSGNAVTSCRPGRRTLHVLQQSLQHTRVMSPGTVTATQTLRLHRETLDVKQHKRIWGLQLKQKSEGCTCPSLLTRLESQLSCPAHPRAVVFQRKGPVAGLAEEGALSQSLTDCRSHVPAGAGY